MTRIRLTQSARTLLALAGSACVSARAPQIPTPGPVVGDKSDQIPVEPATTPLPGEWSIRYYEQKVTYRVTRNAVIESSDSTAQYDSSTNVTRETVSLVSASTDSSDFTVSAVADTFSTTSQGRIGTPQPIRTPIEVGGIFSSSRLSIPTTPGDTSCNPGTSVITADLYNLFPGIPAHLKTGFTWQDSTQTHGCQGGITTTSQSIRSFTVVGEVIRGGQRSIQIESVDSLSAEGQGMQQQHQITLRTNGDGRATYFIDPTTGKVIHLEISQTLHMLVNAEGHDSPFVQKVRQVFEIVR